MGATEQPKLGGPTMIVDQVHVRYRVFGGRRMGASTGLRPSFTKRLFDGTYRHMGAVS